MATWQRVCTPLLRAKDIVVCINGMVMSQDLNICKIYYIFEAYLYTLSSHMKHTLLLLCLLSLLRIAMAQQVPGYISYIIHNGDSVQVKRVPPSRVKGKQRESVLTLQETLTEARTLYLADNMAGLTAMAQKLDDAQNRAEALGQAQPNLGVAAYVEEAAFYKSLVRARQGLEQLVADVTAANTQMAIDRAQRTQTGQPGQGFPPVSKAVQSTPVYKYVNASSLNLRALPSPSGTVLVAVPAASRVEVLEAGGDWHRVRVQGLVGYLSAAYLVDRQEEVALASAQARTASSQSASAAATGGSTGSTDSSPTARPAVTTKGKSGSVYYCASGNTVKYHRSSGCRGLSRCGASIDPIPLSEARQYMDPCKICY